MNLFPFSFWSGRKARGRPTSTKEKTVNFQRVATVLLIYLVILSAVGCTRQPRQEPTDRPVHPAIVFMTDFGAANDAVAICKAVILRINPGVQIMDITHQVTPFSISEGARFLAAVTPYYPAGTVFLVVVDPGVGTSRKPIVAKSKRGQFFVLPDNGLITPVADRDGIESAREIANPAWMIGDKISSTFHGRDIFSPAAAHLAAGEDWVLAGPEVENLVRLNPPTARVGDKGIDGDVVGLDDPFGSLISDIVGQDFKNLGYALGDRVTIRIAKKSYTIPYVKTFADVPVGLPLLYIDSRDRVGIALNQSDFSKVYQVSPPLPIFIPRKSGKPLVPPPPR
jgi:S-adenosylmethionine hydrolase